MIVEIATPEHPAYGTVSRFASQTYEARLRAVTRADPDAFAYAHEHGHIVGCFGMYRAHLKHKLLIETYVPDAFARISDSASVDRRQCAEIGTRAVQKRIGSKSLDVSLALSASLIVYMHTLGVSFVGFTGNRTTTIVARELGIKLITLGEPELCHTEKAFLQNWSEFFRIRQYCFGFKIDSIDGCFAALETLESRGIHSSLAHIC